MVLLKVAQAKDLRKRGRIGDNQQMAINALFADLRLRREL